MLRWSGQEEGEQVDLAALGDGHVAGEDPVAHALHGFATAAVERDDDALGLARLRLARVAGEAFMVDAAAVVANFEMMTRLADGTGARMWEERVDKSAPIIEALHFETMTSRR